MTDIKKLLSIVSLLSQEKKKSQQHNKELIAFSFYYANVCNDSTDELGAIKGWIFASVLQLAIVALQKKCSALSY